jgi:hypothetical protein
MKDPHGLFLPKSYFPDIQDSKTLPLGQDRAQVVLSHPVVYSSPSIVSYCLLAILVIGGLAVLMTNAFLWVQYGSFIGLISTESLLIVIFSSLLAAWVRASYVNLESYDTNNPLAGTSTMCRVRVKEQKKAIDADTDTDTAQFRILKLDTQSYLVALRAKRGQDE